MQHRVQGYESRFVLILIVVIVGLTCLAWSNRFIQDDAFISFRYAENLAHGHGLVWNPTERIEGYTNFLWTLLIAGGISLGCDPLLCSQILGICFFVLSLFFTYMLSRLILQSRTMSLLTVILLGTNYTFSAYATGGLETPMQAALFVMSTFYCIDGLGKKGNTIGNLLILSLLLTLVVLTRLDSALLCSVLFTATVIHLLKEDRAPRERFVNVLCLILPFSVLVGSWFLWKLSYYGDVLPNTFYIKAASSTSPGRGLNYLYRFTSSYLLFAFPIAGIVAAKDILKKPYHNILILVCIILLWVLYIIKIGGDFMEFRFLVPILPITFIFIVWLLINIIRWEILRRGLVALILIGTAVHASTFEYNERDRIEPIKQLQDHIIDEHENWIGIGKALSTFFNHSREVSIATTAAGAIPYYSQLYAVDMLGLNDRWIAKNGTPISTIPGHQRIAPLKYLIERKVNLVISHPLVLRISEQANRFPFLPISPGDDLSGLRIIEIPLDAHYKFLALYLTPSPIVDAAIRNNKWKSRVVVMRKDEDGLMKNPVHH
ncbi:MAG: hypothetical protein HYR76_07135 [Ignavibacteria bacterium]|nr:hypothetical protein [Ignavibacteria bacterium]MBI3765602.1 hypothetical protein [Ignavibacteriales bacterium]